MDQQARVDLLSFTVLEPRGAPIDMRGYSRGRDKQSTLPVQEAIPVNEAISQLKQLHVEEYPRAWNPSMTKFGNDLILAFRYTPNRRDDSNSRIGVVLLNEDLEQISPAELLDTRRDPSHAFHAEDPRVFTFNDKIYLFYNDATSGREPYAHRSMYFAELKYDDGHFILEPPLKLHSLSHPNEQYQKNWVPFVWNNMLFMGYSINPHEVVHIDMHTGEATTFASSGADISWKWGRLRGGTPAELVDGEYMAFFHSGIILRTPASIDKERWHYYMGVYTFAAEPPFNITSISPYPLNY